MDDKFINLTFISDIEWKCSNYEGKSNNVHNWCYTHRCKHTQRTVALPNMALFNRSKKNLFIEFPEYTAVTEYGHPHVLQKFEKPTRPTCITRKFPRVSRESYKNNFIPVITNKLLGVNDINFRGKDLNINLNFMVDPHRTCPSEVFGKILLFTSS